MFPNCKPQLFIENKKNGFYLWEMQARAETLAISIKHIGSRP